MLLRSAKVCERFKYAQVSTSWKENIYQPTGVIPNFGRAHQPPPRVAAPSVLGKYIFAEQILNRTPITAERNDVRDACVHVFCALDLYANDTTSAAILDCFHQRSHHTHA
jgi:hypothetical protein